MKIVYHHRIRSKDGQYVHVSELTNAMRNMGHEVVLVGPACLETSQFGSDSGVIDTLKRSLPRALYEVLELGYSFVAFAKLMYSTHKHRPDALYERYNLFFPAGVWVRKLTGIPLLLEINSPLAEERKQQNGLSLFWLAQWIQTYTWRNADHVLAVSHVMAAIVEAAGVPAHQITVTPNGVDLRRFGRVPTREESKRLLGLEGKVVIGFTGFMRGWHDLDRLLDFMVSCKEDRLRHMLLVGDGPSRPLLERRIHELGIADRVTMTGTIERDRIATYVAAFDIALQTAAVPYASPLKLAEYMSLGCAVVAPDIACMREILTDGENAALYRLDDERSFAKVVNELCASPPLRERLGHAARETVVKKGLTWEENARKVDQAWRSLIRT
jgi:glycosyltransferase involved in cell wall biosynthesis